MFQSENHACPCINVEVQPSKTSKFNQARGTKYMVPSTWYQVHGTKYLVPRTWYQVHGTKYLVPSTWYQVRGTTYLVPSTWYQARGRQHHTKLRHVRQKTYKNTYYLHNFIFLLTKLDVICTYSNYI